MDLTYVYGYIKKNAADDYSVLKSKVDEFAVEGLEPIMIYNILSQYIALKSFCRALDVKNGDYIDFIKAIKIATFLKAKFNNEDAISVMQKTLIYEDNDVCIFKPTNFQESSMIGEPICCFAYSQGRWDEHYNGYQEAIYYVYDVMRENSIHDFVAITVRPSGRALVLDKNHKWWPPAESIRYIQGLGEGASTIVTKEGKSIKTENKQYNKNTNMNKKQIRLTEQDLHRIVKESVNRILNEVLDTTDSIKSFYNSKGEQLSKPKTKIKGMLDPKWSERKKKQMNMLRDRYEDIRKVDRHLNNMDNGYYHHDHIIDDSNMESWLDQESEKYPGFTNRQLRDLADAGFGGKYEELYLNGFA